MDTNDDTKLQPYVPRPLKYIVNNHPPFNTLGFMTFVRTYARRLQEDDKSSAVESWQQCLERVVSACNTQLKCNYTEEEQKEYFDLLYNLKCLVGGRFLWQLGTRTVDRLGLLSLQNCTFVNIDSIQAFTYTFDALMLGAGVGYNLLPEKVYTLPVVKKTKIERKDVNDADFIVPDSREGWVKLLGKVLKAHFYSGKGFVYSLHCIRSRGAPIRTFGGLASGPNVLHEGIQQIHDIFNSRAGYKMRPIDCLDVLNIIGKVVVSGNVRRSAQIALGDVKDLDYLRAKRWDLGNIPTWRCYSNNSVICNDIKELPEEFWDGYQGNGEPYGLININLARSCGRVNDNGGDTRYKDEKVDGVNPCSEIFLESYECCCLSEIFLPRISSKEELLKVAKYCYRTCKHSLAIPCHVDAVDEVIKKNFRIGIGVTGYLMASEEQKSWLSDVYEDLRKFDEIYSREQGFSVSIKLSTTKPSGCMVGSTLILTTKGLLRLDEIGDTKGEQWQEVKDLQAYDDGFESLDFSQPKKCAYIFKAGQRKGEVCGTSMPCCKHKNYMKEEQTTEENVEIDHKTKTNNITKFYVNGKVPTKKIITKDGYKLEMSLQHRLRVLDKDDRYVWKFASELQIEDKLLVRFGDHPNDIVTPLKKVKDKPRYTQKMKQPEILTQDIAWFLGLFYGDGSVHGKGIRISFNRKQPALLKWLTDFFEKTFNLDTCIDDDHSFYINSIQFKKWLKKNQCCKELCEYVRIPKLVRTSSKDNCLAFINGFWRADGGIHSSSNLWSVCTVSEEFAQDYMAICRSIGINVKITNAGPSSSSGGLGSNDRWIVSVRNAQENTKNASKEFRARFKAPFWIDPIASIKDSEAETYDIEVENAHHYRSASYISHNTLSLLGGVTPGCHPAYSQYYIRRVRFASDSALLPVLQKNGYHAEYVQQFDGSLDYTTKVVEFPIKVPDGTVVAKDMTAIKQLEVVKRLQTEWADNSVSVTVYYKKEELPEIKEWLNKYYNTHIKAVSFLLHSDHGFKQAPYEEISKEKYEELSSKVKEIYSLDCSGGGNNNVSDDLNVECAGGACPIK